MPIEWKKNKKLKPEVLIKRIVGITTVSSDGKVSYSGFEYHDVFAALQTMIRYPEDVTWRSRELLLTQAISGSAKKGTLDSKNLIDELNGLYKKKLEQREEEYYLLTSISIPSPFLGKNFRIGSCLIQILESKYPKKFVSRDGLEGELKKREIGNRIDFKSEGYSNVIVSVKSKSIDGAASECLKALDMLRAIWCLFANSTMQLFGNEWSPINSIRLGAFHTLHHKDGAMLSESFWYEPKYVWIRPYQVTSKNYEVLKKNCSFVLSQIKKSKYSHALMNALVRYVRSLDDSDQNAALISLWSAMEELLSPNEANYDLVIKRCTFLFAERDYHRQLLEHLREYRNAIVHSGEHSERTKTLCYQLQFYFYNLIIFYVQHVKYFDSIDQANEFLDLPPDVETLKRRGKMIERATYFLRE
jgi:hypothetical protein